jgi:protocatechuate 3,4-dioxygenase alpha subunit
VTLAPTPSQTVGPFFDFGLCALPQQRELVPPDSPGAIRVEGRLLDGADAPVPDGMVEIWQADAGGRYDGGFGFGRCQTDDDGRFGFTTVKPGAVREPGGRVQAPHLTLLCFARGLLKPVHTRLYFADEAEANAADPVLLAIGSGGDPGTLLAQRTGAGRYELDLRLQGDRQTVFFATAGGAR